MALTGAPDGSPMVAGAGAAGVIRDGLAAIGARRPHVRLPGVEVIGERAAITGWHRNAPWTVGGSGRAVRADDGWWFLSLPRDADLAAVPALVEANVTAPWEAIDRWSASQTRSDAVGRAQLLSLAAAVIPSAGDAPDPQHEHRGGEPVIRHVRGRRRPRADQPLVVDLTSLWAGPLCAALLGETGCRIVKVESMQRLDGARRGPAAFFNVMHGGHDAVTIDFGSPVGRAQLSDLIDRADVVLEASRPRAMDQLGIDPMTYVGRGAIWVSITAYGRSGPWANRVGFGDDIAAAAGLVGWIDEVPVPVGDAIADPLAGVHAASAAVAALDGGEAVLLDVSMRAVAGLAASRSLQPGCSPYPAIASSPTARIPRASAPEAGTDNDRYLTAPSP
jgi:crotonobetainyl-CoA:carnitine CoA-transferase CaiB-like acyl-CoA transferase